MSFRLDLNPDSKSKSESESESQSRSQSPIHWDGKTAERIVAILASDCIVGLYYVPEACWKVYLQR
ncbi:MAG: hypothetical protein D4R82_03390 [Dehalococcoidia bacterium]|nr:MAG: hypothetical protein D4R82_03390 [Dehalococcoidia bacterium]